MRFKRIILKALPNSTFFQNTLILTSGSTLAQAVSFVSLIALQRWFYTPEDFGILGLFVSLSTLFIACSTLKFEYGIVIPKDDQKAFALVQLSSISVVIVSLISVLMLVLFRESLFKLSTEQFFIFLALIPLATLFSGFYEVLIYWNSRQKNFLKMSKSRVVQNSSMEVTRLIAASLRIDHKGLIIGRVLGQLASLVYLLRPFLREQGHIVKKIDLKELRRVFIEYRDFPIFTVPTVFISSFSNLLLIALFFQFYGDSNAGLVSIAIQYIALPFGIISSAFSRVFFQKISTYSDKKRLLSLYTKLATRFGVTSLFVSLSVYMIPDRVITSVIGEEWEGLTEFMRLSVIWQSIAFVSSSLSFIYTRLMKQRVMMLFALLQLAIVYFTLTYSNQYYNDPHQSFLFYVIGQCVYYVLTLIAAIYFIKKSRIIH